jgi:hypothetical protein
MRFQEFSKFIIRPHLFENKQQYQQIMDTMVNGGVIRQEGANNLLKEIKSLLKRADRIIWWLRLFRINQTGEIIKSNIADVEDDTAKSEEEKNQEISELKNLYKKITKKDYDYYEKSITADITNNLRNFNDLFHIGRLEHWSTMFEQSPQVNQVEWEANLDPIELARKLNEAEREWKQKQEQEIEPEPNDQIIIDYGKYAWVKLDKEYCDLEGRAMGHCGNTASPKAGDRLLSFRTKIDGGRQKPHLTFILDKNGFLGEMKGRGNDKPSEKYHSYIIDLLQKDFVKGIKGGGYIPENNFDLSDLDDSTREQLIDAKPALGGISKLYEKEGLTDDVLNLFESQMDSSDLGYEDIVKNVQDPYVIVEKFDDLTEIIDTFSVDRTVSDLKDAVSEDGDFIENISAMVDGTIGEGGYAKDLYDNLDKSFQEKIEKFAKQTAGEADIDNFEDMIEESDGVYNLFRDSIFIGIVSATIEKAQKYLDDWLDVANFVKSEDSGEYQLELPISLILDYMAGTPDYYNNISEIDDWGDILYAISGIDEPTIDIENVYAYNEETAKQKIQDELTELFGEEE